MKKLISKEKSEKEASDLGYPSNFSFYHRVGGRTGLSKAYVISKEGEIRLNDRVALQEKLNKAIQEENYEKAAVYRDKLKLLENQSIQEVNE